MVFKTRHQFGRLKDALSSPARTFKDVFGLNKNNGFTKISDTNKKFSKFVGEAKDGFKNVVEKTKNGVTKMADKSKVGVSKMADKTKESVSKLADKTKESVSKMMDKTKEGYGKLVDKTKEKFSSAKAKSNGYERLTDETGGTMQNTLRRSKSAPDLSRDVVKPPLRRTKSMSDLADKKSSFVDKPKPKYVDPTKGASMKHEAASLLANVGVTGVTTYGVNKAFSDDGDDEDEDEGNINGEIPIFDEKINEAIVDDVMDETIEKVCVIVCYFVNFLFSNILFADSKCVCGSSW